MCFSGDSAALPDSIQWKGASYAKAMWHFWMQSEGVFGVALGVSTSLIFLFVLFGSLLERAGAGSYFIQLSFALFGRFRGGPAKAAVFSSALTGIISGSSIANTVTTGTFTIPLMKRTGFPAEKAGAIEVASSTNGQLTPPVMGAAAFLMVEYTGVSYLEVIKHAFLPAIISYITLFYIVHLEAHKLNLQGLSRKNTKPVRLIHQLLIFLRNCIVFFTLCLFVYYGFGWSKQAFAEHSFWVAVMIVSLIYIAIIRIVAKSTQRNISAHDDEDVDPLVSIEQSNDDFQAIFIRGMHFLLPIFILIWCLMIERFSPSLSVAWATLAMIVVTLTQHPLMAYFNQQRKFTALLRGWNDFSQGMIAGAKNMTTIAIATAVAGIVVGTVSLTGAHQVLGEFVEFLAGGSLLMMLIFVAVLSLILGMGLPTTANYIVVSSLMAPIIVSLGAQSGLVVPLIAAHLFVFYFGILADDTPPVGLAAYAAAGISGGDPIKTGVQGFAYDIRTAILPFMFIFNTDLLLIGVGWLESIMVFITSLMAMMMFASAVQGFFLVRSQVVERLIMLLIAFMLFRPGFFMDQIVEPYQNIAVPELVNSIDSLADDSQVLMTFAGDHPITDKPTTKTILVNMGQQLSANQALNRLNKATGIILNINGNKAVIDDMGFNSLAEKQQLDFDWELTSFKIPTHQPPKQLFFIPALILMAFIWFRQTRRQSIEPN